jgi:hypothetical protein
MVIAQTQDHSILRYSAPAVAIGVLFILSRFLPIRGLSVVVRIVRCAMPQCPSLHCLTLPISNVVVVLLLLL